MLRPNLAVADRSILARRAFWASMAVGADVATAGFGAGIWDPFYVALAEAFDATLLTMDERLARAHEAELQDRATWRRRLIVRRL